MILVTGAAGNIGHALVDVLVEEGADVRAVILPDMPNANEGRFRPPNIAQSSRFPSQVNVVSGDLARPESIPNLFDDIDELFINPRAVGATIESLLVEAKKHGVRRVVTLSASNVDEDSALQPSRYNGDRNKEVERAVMESGMEWSALRSSYYAINTIGMWVPQIKAGNIVRGPYAAWENTPLHEKDVAAVAAKALLTDIILGQRPIITGPESLTQREMVEMIGRVIGRPLTYEEVPLEVARRGILQNGFSEAFVDAFLALMAREAGKPGFLSNEIEKILGRPAHTYAEWVADHKTDFTGNEA